MDYTGSLSRDPELSVSIGRDNNRSFASGYFCGDRDNTWRQLCGAEIAPLGIGRFVSITPLADDNRAAYVVS